MKYADKQTIMNYYAEMEGYSAGLKALGIGSCSYNLNTVEWHSWMTGYRAGYNRGK